MTPNLQEIDFQVQVTDLAELHKWEWVHFRPARTEYGWKTPVSGPLGAGWPDLVLVRRRDNRLIFAELKSNAGKVSPDQERVLELLRALTSSDVEVHVWRPRDYEAIKAVLA